MDNGQVVCEERGSGRLVRVIVAPRVGSVVSRRKGGAGGTRRCMFSIVGGGTGRCARCHATLKHAGERLGVVSTGLGVSPPLAACATHRA